MHPQTYSEEKIVSAIKIFCPNSDYLHPVNFWPIYNVSREFQLQNLVLSVLFFTALRLNATPLLGNFKSNALFQNDFSQTKISGNYLQMINSGIVHGQTKNLDRYSELRGNYRQKPVKVWLQHFFKKLNYYTGNLCSFSNT